MNSTNKAHTGERNKDQG